MGGVITAQAAALLTISNSFGISPWLYAALVLMCIVAVAWVAHGRLHSLLPAFALVETMGGTAGMWLALLLLSPPVNRYATPEPFVLDFLATAGLVGLTAGAVVGVGTGALIGLLDQEVMAVLRPWLWLLGVVIAIAAIGGLLLVDDSSFLLGFAPILIVGGALSGWIAQQEVLRLEEVTSRQKKE